MDLIQMIAEKRIEEAMERGDFDNLPGAGKPLQLDDDPNVPAELKMAYKILRNAGVVPAEVETHREIRRIEDMLAGLDDEQQQTEAQKRLAVLRLKLEGSRPRGPWLSTDSPYHGRVVGRLCRRPGS